MYVCQSALVIIIYLLVLSVTETRSCSIYARLYPNHARAVTPFSDKTCNRKSELWDNQVDLPKTVLIDTNSAMRKTIPVRATVKERTAQQPARFSLEWTLENFSSHEINSSELILSKGITMSELELNCDCRGRWCIAIRPCEKILKDDATEEKYVSLYLHLANEPGLTVGNNGSGEFGVDFKFRLMRGGRLIKQTAWGQITQFSGQSRSWGYNKFCEHGVVFNGSDLMDGSGLKTDNSLTVTAEVIVYHKAKPETIDILKTTAPAIIIPDTSSVSVHQEAMERQIAFCRRAASHQHSSNFSIQSSDGKTFDTSRFILMAHSQVFEAMLSHDSVEKTTGISVMNDADSETVEIFLDYLYGCEIKKINLNNAEKVLIIADKYHVMGLLPICEIILAESISVKNAAHYLVLACERGLDILKQTALKSISRGNMTTVLGGGGAKELAEYDPQLVQLVMEQCVE